MKRYDPEYIDQEEENIFESLRKINLKKLAKPSANEQSSVKKAAKEFLKNETKMNIRISSEELQRIKDQASREGLRYQTLVKSVLHKYVTGQLMERK